MDRVVKMYLDFLDETLKNTTDPNIHHETIKLCKDTFKKLLKEEVILNKFANIVTNEELQKTLAQYPKDATVAVEYCNIKSLQYFPDRNFIAID